MTAAYDWWRLRELRRLGGRLSRARDLDAAQEIGRQIAALGDDRGEPEAGGWRERRLRLRRAGHLVEQVDGVVYVDGRRSNDPGLRP